MKVLIIGGFLGSGKTTALLQMAEYLVKKSRGERPSTDIPVVILENEASSMGIDQQLLSRSGFKVRELLAGCICCSSSAQLIHTVRSIQEEYNPKWLIIEATGLAYPDAIWQALQAEFQIDAGILTLVDASRWIRLVKAMPQFVTAQIEKADRIIINKADLATGQQLEQIRESLRAFHTPAQICEASMKDAQDVSFWDEQMKTWEGGYE